MFCKWCGNKIRNIGNPCPSCGRDQDPLENGNGFWDLCDLEPKPGDEPKRFVGGDGNGSPKATPPKAGAGQILKGISPWLIVACVLFVALTLETVLGARKISKLSSRLEEVQSELDELEGKKKKATDGEPIQKDPVEHSGEVDEPGEPGRPDDPGEDPGQRPDIGEDDPGEDPNQRPGIGEDDPGEDPNQRPGIGEYGPEEDPNGFDGSANPEEAVTPESGPAEAPFPADQT